MDHNPHGQSPAAVNPSRGAPDDRFRPHSQQQHHPQQHQQQQDQQRHAYGNSYSSTGAGLPQYHQTNHHAAPRSLPQQPSQHYPQSQQAQHPQGQATNMLPPIQHHQQQYSSAPPSEAYLQYPASMNSTMYSTGQQSQQHTPQQGQQPQQHSQSNYLYMPPAYPGAEQANNQHHNRSFGPSTQFGDGSRVATPTGHHSLHYGQPSPATSLGYGSFAQSQFAQQHDHTGGSAGIAAGSRLLDNDDSSRQSNTETVASQAGAAAGALPDKDENGKFQCQHCEKTYLHAKHLKRHMLKHTGIRPYLCALCGDTFARSDILKRHFQKCSVRKGNPEGISHLAGSQFQIKKLAAKRAAAAELNAAKHLSIDASNSRYSGTDGNEGAHSAGLPGQSGDFGLSADGSRSYTSLKSEHDLSRGHLDSMSGYGSISSLDHRSSGDSRYHNDLYGAGRGYTNQHGDVGSQFSMQGPNSAAAGWPHDAYSWSGPNAAGRGQHGQERGIENPGAMNMSDVSGNATVMDLHHGYNLAGVPQQSSYHHMGDIFAEEYAHLEGFNAWNLPQQQSNNYEMKAAQLLLFLEQYDDQHEPLSPSIKALITGQNLCHCILKYRNFQGHWPVIHVPTLNVISAYDGLVLTMFCIGAVYSRRFEVDQVRTLMRRTRIVIEKTSHVANLLAALQTQDMSLFSQPLSHDTYEHLVAIILLTQAYIWHAANGYRPDALYDFGQYADILKQYGISQSIPMSVDDGSILHQTNIDVNEVSFENWNWQKWVWQEKLSRLVHISFVVDCALSLYFNYEPRWDVKDVTVPLPSDDMPWEATSSDECAIALGLMGPQAQLQINITGSCRKVQPSICQAVQVLQHPHAQMVRRSTNAYGKFMIVHAIIVQIWKIKRNTLQPAMYSVGDFIAASTTSPNVCIGDWISIPNPHTIMHDKNALIIKQLPANLRTNGDALLQTQELALRKWKQAWDEDMPVQYPPGRPRVGFGRDGVLFYYLALRLIRTGRPDEWFAQWQARFLQVVEALKQTRNFVSSASAQNGGELGAIAEMDDQYGVGDLSLDMKLLFAPIEGSDDGNDANTVTIDSGM